MNRFRLFLGLWFLVGASAQSLAQRKPVQHDVAIYGATPAGIAAAIAMARSNDDLRILLVTPYKRVGGLITNGLSHPDFRTFEARTGLFRKFNSRVEEYYRGEYGADSQQVKDSLSGTHAGPEVNHRILREMLDLPGIEILTQHRLTSAEVRDSRIACITLKREGKVVRVKSHYFVDASYEGDVMAAADVPFCVGREAESQYGENLAPEIADDQVQGYNFRLTMTDVPQNRVPISKPAGYNRDDYANLVTLLKAGDLPRIFGDPLGGLPGGIYKRQTPQLPNGKRDINDVSHSVVRLSLPNINNGWPDGSAEVRDQIFAAHVRHNLGVLYFLQNDPAVPRKFAVEAQQWGLCRDELIHNDHLPEQLYVREARRMLGRYVFTQKDVERVPGSHHARAVFHSDAVAMGDYGPNCHGTFHEGPQIGGRHTGEFYQLAAPYQIPYGTLLPKDIENLAVPVACSSTHVGFCALRLEPIWMSLGQASGEAIAIAFEEKLPLHRVSSEAVRARLHQTATATIYTSDVPEESVDFEAVQWWGSLGGLVAIDRTQEDEPADYGARGENIIGQYYKAFPGHAVELSRELSERVRSEWLNLARSNELTEQNLGDAKTRGDFIRTAWQAHFQAR